MCFKSKKFKKFFKFIDNNPASLELISFKIAYLPTIKETEIKTIKIL